MTPKKISDMSTLLNRGKLRVKYILYLKNKFGHARNKMDEQIICHAVLIALSCLSVKLYQCSV